MDSDKNDNIIKRVKNKYKLSYDELEKITGAKKSTLTKCASTGEVSETIEKNLLLYEENHKLKEELHGLEYLKIALRRFLDIK